MEYRLEELFDLQMGKTPSRSVTEYWESGNNKWISIADLSKCGKYIYDTKECLSDIAVSESGIKQIPANTVVMSFKLSIGKTAITSEPMYSNEAIMSFRDRKLVQLLPEYIYYLLLSKNWDDGTNKAVMGKTLNKATLSKVKVNIHSMQEQQEIVYVLNQATALIELHQQQLQKLDELVKARFVELFGDLKTNPKKWPILSFPEFAKIDGNMTTDYEKYADYPHIGIDSIEKGTGKLSGYRTVREDGVISGKYIFTPKHIIYSKIRPNLNKVALPNFCGLCSADAYPILPNYKNCNRIFLATAMRSEYFLEYILQFSSRTNLPKVNRKEIAGFRMPLPPLSLQEQFATFVEQVDKSKVAVQKSLDEAQLMFDSLMQQYFG
ncbi:MAG: restriction endonuclease subunit S [Subdoligranulum sp.]|nr:restriction endonuclease subunit S [Subdoligranulum sp.]MDY6125347.1 restriction endonuclease subunit S [Gemmiger qucibialis]